MVSDLNIGAQGSTGSEANRRAPEEANGPGGGAGFTDGFHAVPDGIKIHYRDYPPAGGVARGVPVVCLHGLSRNVKDFQDVALAIAATGRRVITMSMRGRGQSGWDSQSDRYHPGVYAGDVTSVLDALDIPRAVFIGTSMGGIIAMVIAVLAPDRVAAAVLNDIGPEISDVGLDRIKSYVGRGTPAESWEEAANRARATNGKAFPRETETAFWDAFARRTYRETDAGVVLDYDPAIGGPVRQGQAGPPDLWPGFDAFAGKPLLIVRGALSDILTADTVAQMKARRADLTYVEIAEVGHAPMLTEPAASSALQQFLSEID